MMTVLENNTTEEHRFLSTFLWAKRFNTKDIHKEMSPIYGGIRLPRKAVHIWVETRGKRFADDEELETEVRKWLRQQSKTSMLRVSTRW
jgi:hypothetical protein